MATKKDTLKTKKGASARAPGEDRNLGHETLRDFGNRNMKVYGVTVNLDRSVPDLFDGLKPVHRRILWAASHQEKRFIKSARLVGDVIGKYHPHGDGAAYDALVTLVNQSSPTMLGDGNWGSMVDGAAAARYTNTRMSQYGLSFMQPDYIHKDVTTFVPNFDDSEIEPVTLPAQLPNVLLNGGEGIGVGITTHLPTFTPESVVAILQRMLKGEDLTARDYAKTLKYSHKYGGQLVKTKENQKGWLSMFETSKGKVQFESLLDIDRDNKRITISDWPPGTNVEKFVQKVRTFPETQRCYNSKGSTTYSIECKPAYNYAQFDKFVEKVRKATLQNRSFKINVTLREVIENDGKIDFETHFLSLSIPELLKKWLELRTELELKSLAYRIKKQEAAIAYTELLIYAVDHVDSLMKALKAKDPDAMLVKLMKVTAEQAKQLLDLPTRRWSRMDQEQMKIKLKEQQAHLKQLGSWQKKPKGKILADLESLIPAIEKDRAYESAKASQKFKVV
ncbi:DNA topoisomerase II [Burkholderia phage BcepSaruman]|uniref:GyrA-like type IIA DNA topoisomerase n=1 Tax=Burkholderia phage BcepSaruman TaxID=2530032 RepID=A0A4D5ZGD3_9CAUD|nr:DNA topoisomerase II [Burkholderia phage BcepSaruman]QBX06582.1 GyrA-like type IIA DNA topoisomerase [Burkholderia phage BcepSaruman]